MRCIVSAVAVGLLLGGCANSAGGVASTEDYLAAAGFSVLPGNASGYYTALRQLPPHRFVHHTAANGVLTYYYLDPTGCGCLYYGGQQQWDAYRQEMAQRQHIEAEQFLEKADSPYTGQGGI